MSKKIYVLLGHPNSDTLSGSFADLYEKIARAAGHEVRRANIGDLSFDPILHKGYKEIQALEPDLKQVQEDIRWCDHFVLFYPIWWSAMPALLKGMIERMWLPAFAFRFKKMADGKTTVGWEKLLKGKTARVIVTLKNFPLLERFMYGDYTSEMMNATLRFSGFKARLMEIGGAESLSEKARTNLGKKIAAMARKGV
jgi:NAD(P)H dehydrogenase (quinone)